MTGYRWDLESRGKFNKVRKVLAESGLVTLAAFAPQGQAYVLSGTEAIPTENPEAYFDEVSRRRVGVLNSKSLRFEGSYDVPAELREKIDSVLE